MSLPSLSSPIFGGGLMLMISGFVLALARDIPMQVFEWIKRQVTISVLVNNSDPCFNWLTLWLNDHPYTKKARRLAVSTQGHDKEEPSLIKTVFSPSPGNHLLVYKDKWMWLHRVRKEAPAGSQGINDMLGLAPPEEYMFTMFGRDQKVIRDLIQGAYELMLKQTEEGASVFIQGHYYWSKLNGYQPRPLASVILPGNEVEKILADINEFLTSREWYHERGIPYRRGYLFYGKPGSGKTSLIMGLSDELKLNIHVLNLGNRSVSDDSLPGLMRTVPPRSIVLMEDIDAVVPDREIEEEEENEDVVESTPPSQPSTSASGKSAEKKAAQRVSLSCLLNCLDGVMASNGSMVFMTSNHPERLDPALTRPGRIDVRKEFGYVQDEQAQKLFQRFYPGAPIQLVARIGIAVKQITISMADLQQVFLEHKFDPHTACNVVESKLFIPTE